MTEPFLDDPVIPDGCIVSAAVKVTEYLDPEGETMYVYTRSPGVSYSNVIGLLDMVKHALEHEAEDANDD